MERLRAESIVDGFLNNCNMDLGRALAADVLSIVGPMAPPWDDVVRLAIEELAEARDDDPAAGAEKLAVVLETTGGYIETVERMVRAMRQHYQEVIFIIPNFAYSAGTVLALSGDDIYMDYHSVLGPIDPQYGASNGEYVPGMGYLAKYKELVQTINAAPDAGHVRAEISYLIEKFDPAKLFHIEQAIEHSKSLLREWLPRYKFKNWHARSTSGAAVSDADKQTRANEIAEVLGDAQRWHSHGRGITCDDLGSEEIKLKINNYGTDAELKRSIRNYHNLLVDYMGKRSWPAAIHTKLGLRSS
ncbi:MULTISPECIES: SDH family Clp fold serine proteinase [unclassified Pseudoxanthomonas]|uniref:SDH family Clp fold serine proteinase n=1 Tax=unclassified Pseudoxanthomonas TaxID=2645906 RepID=UPI0003625968|nr:MULTISPECIES: hypothetical protein [unclassified Pseudoxanthomonas]